MADAVGKKITARLLRRRPARDDRWRNRDARRRVAQRRLTWGRVDHTITRVNVQDHQGSHLEALAPTLRPIVAFPADQGRSLFVHGTAGSGKTTALQRRLLSLLAGGTSSYTILTLLPQPGAAQGYREVVSQGGLGPYLDLHLATYSGLAREMVTLFWPAIAGPAGFAAPHRPPTFLSYELAQVQMERVIAPLRSAGAFEGLRLRPQQILSQLLDNLNRAALNGLSLAEMEERLVTTWSGDPERVIYFEQAADAARRFRQHCLDSNSLDVSLIIDLFQHHLVEYPVFRDYLTGRYRHLLVDNVEELAPAGISFLRFLLPSRDSAVLAYDDLGGYRRFLGADPEGAWALREACDEVLELEESLVAGPGMAVLGEFVRRRMTGGEPVAAKEAARGVQRVIQPRYRREMVRQVVQEIGRLQGETVAIIVPYLDQAVSYALASELEGAGLPHRILRRRGNPRDEPLVRAWLTLAALAHPHWQLGPTEYDVAEGLMLAIGELDWPRAILAAQCLYDRDGPSLRPVDTLTASQETRLGKSVVADLATLTGWLENWPSARPLDQFFRDLFSDLWEKVRQSEQRGQSAEREAAVCAWLAGKAERFRRAAPALGLGETTEQAKTFVAAIFQGLVTGDPLPAHRSEPLVQEREPILVATVYAYMLAGPVVDIQVWLDGASTGWWEIPRQPLSNAFVLTPGWPAGRRWTEADSAAIRNELLARIVYGLSMRCRRKVLLASSDLDERGERQDGPLWRALLPVIDAVGNGPTVFDNGLGVW